jgi:hypothetical protein
MEDRMKYVGSYEQGHECHNFGIKAMGNIDTPDQFAERGALPHRATNPPQQRQRPHGTSLSVEVA